MDAYWLFHRLRTMTPAEAARHAWRLGRDQVWKRRSWNAPTPNSFPAAEPWAVPATARRIANRAEHLLGRRIQVFSLPPEQPFDWTVDVQSGLQAPVGFGPRLDYRDSATVGSAKNIWEKGRHHHWPVLALALRATDDDRFGRELVDQARSWVAQCPFPRGIQWASALEAGMRLVSWVWTERLLRGTKAHGTLFGTDGLLWNEIYWHQWYLSRMISGGSSANNHVIGESVGLYLAASNWPVYKESKSWARMARSIANEAAMAQFFPSGLNAEMGFSYHLYSTELLLLAMTEMDRQGEPAPPDQWDRMAKAIGRIAALRDVGGNLPTYGDSDDAFTVWIEPEGTRREAFLEDVGARLFGWPTPQPTLGASLVTQGGPVRNRPAPSVPGGSFAIDDAGLFVLASQRGTQGELFAIADAGPLGYGRMMAHGHSDALSFTLSVGGHPVLVDPGTGNYHGDPPTRLYLRSVQAHNTLSIDGADQAVSRGLFMWHRPYKCRVEHWEPSAVGGRLVASHDGFERLEGKPRHRRTVAMVNTSLTIEDQVEGEGKHDIEVRYHFHPSCKVVLDGAKAVAAGPFGAVNLELDPALIWTLHCGDAVGGWYSPGFGWKIPTTTLVGKARGKLPFISKMALEVSDAR